MNNWRLISTDLWTKPTKRGHFYIGVRDEYNSSQVSYGELGDFYTQHYKRLESGKHELEFNFANYTDANKAKRDLTAWERNGRYPYRWIRYAESEYSCWCMDGLMQIYKDKQGLYKPTFGEDRDKGGTIVLLPPHSNLRKVKERLKVWHLARLSTGGQVNE